ncbi:MAG: KpsF/GutQ family sugar-phosphate isomerase [Pseudomonadales bacterium]|nr:KpsF/GutQ family sugar-phosphate isomerase [Pseudomonadales bacterium]
MTDTNAFIESALRTIRIEHDSVAALSERIDASFIKACELVLASKGRVVVTGMGKSGHIGNKIAATLASTGTPAMAMHPAEASHGDLGMITPSDIVLAISNSGNTEELTSLLPALKRKDIPLISMTGDSNSVLAQASDTVLDISVSEEACPLGLAPTSSTTATLVMGDALAMALLEARGFTHDDFAMSHPGGKLGRRLLVRVQDLMHSGDEIPMVSADTALSEALIEMSRKGFGLTTVADSDRNISGVFTDGDLRRALDAGKDLQNTSISQVMSSGFVSIAPGALAVEAVKAMQDANVYVLIVKNEGEPIAGIIKMHDLLQANVV